PAQCDARTLLTAREGKGRLRAALSFSALRSSPPLPHPLPSRPPPTRQPILVGVNSVHGGVNKLAVNKLGVNSAIPVNRRPIPLHPRPVPLAPRPDMRR